MTDTHRPSVDAVLPASVAFLGTTDKIVGGRKYSNRNLEELVPSFVLILQGTMPASIPGGVMTTASIRDST